MGIIGAKIFRLALLAQDDAQFSVVSAVIVPLCHCEPRKGRGNLLQIRALVQQIATGATHLRDDTVIGRCAHPSYLLHNFQFSIFNFQFEKKLLTWVDFSVIML